MIEKPLDSKRGFSCNRKNMLQTSSASRRHQLLEILFEKEKEYFQQFTAEIYLCFWTPYVIIRVAST